MYIFVLSLLLIHNNIIQHKCQDNDRDSFHCQLPFAKLSLCRQGPVCCHPFWVCPVLALFHIHFQIKTRNKRVSFFQGVIEVPTLGGSNDATCLVIVKDLPIFFDSLFGQDMIKIPVYSSMRCAQQHVCRVWDPRCDVKRRVSPLLGQSPVLRTPSREEDASSKFTLLAYNPRFLWYWIATKNNCFCAFNLEIVRLQLMKQVM